jgi:hypothetical protein
VLICKIRLNIKEKKSGQLAWPSDSPKKNFLFGCHRKFLSLVKESYFWGLVPLVVDVVGSRE